MQLGGGWAPDSGQGQALHLLQQLLEGFQHAGSGLLGRLLVSVLAGSCVWGGGYTTSASFC